MKNDLNKAYKDLRKMLEKGIVSKDYDLRNHNTYFISCIAKVVVNVNSLETFMKTILYCKDNDIKPVILARGSNVILASARLNRLVIIFGEKFNNIFNLGSYVICESGATISEIINYCRNVNLSGMEEAIGIPGSIGGAVYMNAQAFGYETSKVLSSVLVYRDGKICEIDARDLNFGYRYSSFMDSNDIILRVELSLSEDSRENIADRIKTTALKRASAQKIAYPNAGSVFKNGNNYFAGEMIDKCGLKNYNIGKAYVSNFHANFIENRGGATGEDIIELIHYIQEVVLDRYNIKLELEQRIIGDEK